MKMLLGILAGLITYAIIGLLGLYLLKYCWTNYAIASIDKSYSNEMLLFRLVVALFASIAAGMCVSIISNNSRTSSWIVSIILFSIAAYTHFVNVWNDYPIWYHLVYLFTILPTLGLFADYRNRRMKLR